MVLIQIVYTNQSTCGMDSCVAIRICPYRDHSLGRLDKALRVVFHSNMQYTCYSYVGERCFCRIVHGTKVELKTRKKINWNKISIIFYVLFCIQWVSFPVDTGRKLNIHKTLKRRPGHLLNVLRTFNLRPVSTGLFILDKTQLLTN